jgi:hypothetical protein
MRPQATELNDFGKVLWVPACTGMTVFGAAMLYA